MHWCGIVGQLVMTWEKGGEQMCEKGFDDWVTLELNLVSDVEKSSGELLMVFFWSFNELVVSFGDSEWLWIQSLNRDNQEGKDIQQWRVGSRIWRETDTGVMRAAPHIECPHSVSNMMRIMMTIVMMMMMMMITCDGVCVCVLPPSRPQLIAPLQLWKQTKEGAADCLEKISSLFLFRTQKKK